LQTEWQKKSADSLLVGGEAHYGIIKADSSLVPVNLEINYPQTGINKVRFLFWPRPRVYAYTLGRKQHYFVTGSLSLNLNLGFSAETDRAHIGKNVYTSQISTYRFSGGYNSSNWHIQCHLNGQWLTGTGSLFPK